MVGHWNTSARVRMLQNIMATFDMVKDKARLFEGLDDFAGFDNRKPWAHAG